MPRSHDPENPESPDEVESPDEADVLDASEDGATRREVSEADWLDQLREVTPGERRGPIPGDPDVPEADALEQSTEVPLDDDRVE